MTDTVTNLAAQGKALSPDERLRLVDMLLASLKESSSPEIEAAWTAEIERRVAKFERGEGKTYDAEDVMAEAARLAP